jgi:predicted glycosyltransferase
MNILVDINHPAHVHLFKHMIRLLRQKGHRVLVTVKEIPAAKQLLINEQIEFIPLGNKKSDSLAGKALRQVEYDRQLWQLARKEQIDIGIGSSVTIAHVSRFCRMKSIFLDDDDDQVEPLIVKYVHPFCDTILSPVALRGQRQSKHNIFYNGTHELAYLHPNRFKPNPKVLGEIGLEEGEPYFVMRFNAFKAHHDGEVKGLTTEQKIKLADMLKPKGKILITAEREIIPELQQYQIQVAPEKVHDLLYYATLFVGDSQTMTSEAAILGTPAFRCNTLVGKLKCISDLEETYGLAFGFLPSDFDRMLQCISTLVSQPGVKKEWDVKRQRFLAEKIDVTAFLTDFTENYPDSITSLAFNN